MMVDDVLSNWSIEITTFIDNSPSLVLGLFDPAGQLIYANRGLYALLGGLPEREISLDSMIKPEPAAILSAAPQAEPIYTGWITFDGRNARAHSVRGKLWRRADQLILLAEYDIEELNQANQQVIALNDEITHLQRELTLKNTHLEQSLAERETINKQLQAEIVERERIEQALQQTSDQLEERVALRTDELEQLTETLKAEIHDRQQKEIALKESEQRLSLAMKAGQHAAWDWNLVSGEVVRSPLWGEMLGYEPTTDLDTSIAAWENLLHPDDVPEIMTRLDAHLVGDTPFFDCEYRLRTNSGDWIWVHDHGLVIERNAAHQPRRMMGTHRNITARKQAEEALQKAHDDLERRVAERTAALAQANAQLQQEINERMQADQARQISEERLELALRGADLGWWDWNLETEQGVFDAQWAKMLGYTHEELITAYTDPWNSLCHPDDRARAEHHLQAHLAGETPLYQAELRMLAKDGEWRWILSRAKVVTRNDQGKPVRITGTHLDITERKQAEKNLRESEERFRRIITDNVDGIIIVDQAGILQFVNPAAEAMFKRPANELVGTMFGFPIVSDTVELELGIGSSSITWVDMRVVTINWHGEVAYLASLRDATERKETEKRLEDLTHDLGERVKELNCLYNIAHLVDIPGITLDEIMQGTVELIPPSWQYPDMTCARITLEDKTFCSTNFEETPRRLRHDLIVHGTVAGHVEVFCLAGCQPASEKPFLNEEHDLLYAIAAQLGDIIEHKRAEVALAREANINAALADLSEALLQAASFDEMSLQVLNIARALTQSQFGYVGYIDARTNHLISPTLTYDIWDQCQVEGKDFVFKDWGGLWGWVLKHHTPLLTNDPSSDARSSGTPSGHLPIERFLSAPALIGDKLVGQIALANSPTDYTDQDLILVERLAVLFAIAVQRKTAEDVLRQQAAEQAALYGIAAAVVTTLQPDELGKIALDVALTVLSADAGWITFFPNLTASKTPQIVALRSMVEGLIPADLRGMCTRCDYYMRYRDQLSDVLTGSVVDQCELLAVSTDTAISGYPVCTPLIAGGQVLGMLTLVWETNSWDVKKNQLLLQTIGRQIGIALHNAQLYQAARQVDRLRSLIQLDHALMDAALDATALIHATLQHLVTAVNATMGAVMMPTTDDHSMALQLITAENGWIEADVSETFMARWQPLWQSLQAERKILSFTDKELVSIPALHTELMQTWGIHGLIVPIGDSAELRAVMILGGRDADHPFVDEDRALLMTAASRTNQALRNAQLYQAEQVQRQLAEALRDTAAMLNGTLNFDDVLDLILEHVGRVVPHDSASVALLEGDTARLVRCHGFEERNALQYVTGITFPVNEIETLRRMVATGQAIARPDVFATDDWIEIPGVDWIRSHVVAPIQLEGETIGFLSLDSATPEAFTDVDAGRLLAFAHQAATAIQNARLYEQLRSSLAERERTQAQLIHSEKTAALGRLTASIAHEINNPIQAVQGCLTLAQTQLDLLVIQPENASRFEKLTRYLGVVDDEIDRISTIVKQMRDFYRPAHEVFQLTDIHVVLDSVINLVEMQLQINNVTIERQWVPDLLQIVAKPDHLKQVFLNLILNANDAMPHGGVLRITTANTRLQPPYTHPLNGETTRAISVAFQDAGEGIPADELEHLFEPFFTTKPHGSGLGLSVSYNIVQMHQGKLEVESIFGQGATFTVILPVEQRED